MFAIVPLFPEPELSTSEPGTVICHNAAWWLPARCSRTAGSASAPKPAPPVAGSSPAGSRHPSSRISPLVGERDRLVDLCPTFADAGHRPATGAAPALHHEQSCLGA